MNDAATLPPPALTLAELPPPPPKSPAVALANESNNEPIRFEMVIAAPREPFGDDNRFQHQIRELVSGRAKLVDQTLTTGTKTVTSILTFDAPGSVLEMIRSKIAANDLGGLNGCAIFIARLTDDDRDEPFRHYNQHFISRN